MPDLHDPTTKTQALIFSADDDQIGRRHAQALVGGLTRAGVQAQHINKLSTSLDDLLLVAKYRIVEVPFVVLIDVDTGEVRGRLSGAPSTRVMLDTLSRLG